MIRIWITLLFALLCLELRSQNPLSEGTPLVDGYNIVVSKPDLENKLFYLIGNYGKTIYVIDSCVAKKGILSFKNKKKLIPCGVYTITQNPKNHFSLGDPDTCLNIILNKSNRCSVIWKDHAFTFEGNEESAVLYTFLHRWSHSQASYDPVALDSLLNEYTDVAPDAFVTKYIQARAGHFAHQAKNTLKSLPFTDLTEPRLLYAPIDLLLNIEGLSEYENVNSDTLIKQIAGMLDNCTNDLVKNYYIRELFLTLDKHNADFDPAIVYLYDNYSHDWITEEEARRFERKIKNLRRILPGAGIPEIISHDKTGKPHSTNNIDANYTVLWLWDPDCDHCQEMTPLLHQLYVDHAAEANFEVFAVEVNDDYDRWVAFSDQHQLWDWINLSTSMGEQNIDLIEYFDIMTTPVIFLIDNTQEHTIIARQPSLEELRAKLHIEN